MYCAPRVLPSNALPATRPDPASRDPWRDNARVVLIVLVVFGHCLEPLGPETSSFDAIYRFIYLFHIPAFAFLSGSVARADANVRLLRSTVFRVLLPYLLFQGLYALVAQTPGWPDDGPAGAATPYWLLWYLLSLAGWRLLLPLFARLRHPILIAVGLAVAAGLAGDLGYYLSLSRTLVFFPLFLLGWRYADAWRSALSGTRWRMAAVIALVALFAIANWQAMDPRWLYGSLGYAALGVDAGPGMALRLLQLVAGIVGTAAFLTLIPRRPLAVSALGPGTLQTFLVHGFLIKLAVAFGAFAWLRATVSQATVGPALLLLSIVCVLALNSERSRQWLSPLTAPRWLEQRIWHDPAPAVPSPSERAQARP
jgi:fucose 4-O-acetylase-like acetyltransferase